MGNEFYPGKEEHKGKRYSHAEKIQDLTTVQTKQVHSKKEKNK
jgi:hypothetical protein